MADLDYEAALCKRLYEARRNNAGIRLSADELADLMQDDAIGTRITNAAARLADSPCEGGDATIWNENAPTWKRFVAHFKESP